MAKKSKFYAKLRRVNQIALTVAVVFAASAVLLGAVFAVVTLTFAERTLPTIKIGEVKLGNLDREAIVAAISQIEPAEIAVTAADKTAVVKPESISLSYDARVTADGLIALSEPERLVMLEPLQKHAARFSYDEQKLDQLISDLAKEVDAPAKDAAAELTKGILTVKDAAAAGRRLDKAKLKAVLIDRYGVFDFSPISAEVSVDSPKVTAAMLNQSLDDLQAFLNKGLILKLDEEKFKITTAQLIKFLELKPAGEGALFSPRADAIAAYVKTLAKQTDRPVKDANLKMVDGKVEIFQASQEGRAISKDKAVEAIAEALESDDRVVELPVKVTEPKVTTASVNDLGIRELIGAATTNFRNSPENRKHNIANGADRLNGILIAPDQTFSTIEALGDPDEASGYLPELVIKENRTVPEFGGGLCQVSTTLFRAAMNAGLPINERQNHSWRISYYEPPVGLDATVYFPKPDLKFKNDTPGWILIQSKIEATAITFEFYGTKDGRRSEVSSRLLSSTPAPEAVYVESDTVVRGQTKQVEKAHPGGRAAATYKVFDKDGNLVNDQTFSSSYKAVPARFLVGTAEPAPAPAEEPAPAETQPSSEQVQQ